MLRSSSHGLARTATGMILMAASLVLGLPGAPWTAARDAAAAPVLEGYTLETYVDLNSSIETLSFAPDGVLYVGYDYDGPILRVEAGGTGARWYGNGSIADPDAVLFDASGAISGMPGSVLVAGVTMPNGSARIDAIWPDESIHQVFFSSSVHDHPSELKFADDGALLIADGGDTGGTPGVFRFDGDTMTLLCASSVGVPRISVDAQGNIFGTYNDGVIRIHSSDGTLLDDAFVTGLPTSQYIGLEVGPGGVWGTNVYVLADGILRRYDGQGNEEILGSGFGGSARDIEFGPDSALYVSDRAYAKVWRITPIPEPSTALLLGFGLVAVAAARRRRGLLTR